MASTMKIVLGRVVPSAAVIAAVAVAGLYGLQLARAGAEREIYRDRLRELAGQYEDLRGVYNEAVRKTAVTELIVADGKLHVRVRNAEGVIQEIETPYDPRREVYLDYVLVEGRVWIRRVFDEQTPPSEGVVIDPRLAHIDWDLSGAEVGKAVYRSLSDGRWVVSVTGTGSRGLVKLGDGAGEVALSPPPAVVEYETVEAEIEAEIERVKLRDLWKRVVGE
ncbi:MAG: hypothetical protein R3B49_00500 [Phycisphaerales bacterium]